MPSLTNKTILILSPQSWGNMFVSKHHYAIELARRGNTIYFLNPPDQVKVARTKPIEIKASGIHPNLYLIEHALSFPYQLKFRAMPVFHWFMKFHIQKILKEIGNSIDIVWSFDLGNLYPLTYFRNSFKIFHPVDEPLTAQAINAAAGADIIFSVTTEILEKYHLFPASKHFINHGVTEGFMVKEIREETGDPVRIGFSGNLLRNDIDRETLLKIVSENKNCVFEFWGSYTQAQGNIGGVEDQSVKQFIQSLKSQPHVILHGAIPSSALASELKRMDAFLICYDVQKDQSKGTNYHKIMEYLATGKVVISNNVTTYKDKPSLVQMIDNREDNHSLPDLFREIITQLHLYNNKNEAEKRRDFALKNTYSKQLEMIDLLINNGAVNKLSFEKNMKTTEENK